MNNQESGVSGRKPPGRRGGAATGIRVGEIVEVEGGHIIRSTGRKDRHSKVCTAKGPRDRRVRLSAHTAIQFYDVQDRLGYDRPSKAVDWLMIKAKSAIDELEKLPPWNPPATASASAGDGVYGGNNDERSNLFPPEMDSDSIPDTINAPAAETAAPAVQFQSYLDGRSQDLRLSLQSFQDPNRNQEQQEEHQSQFGFGWNMAVAGGYNAGVGGFMFIPPPPQQPPPILLGHGVGQAATHFFTQRGTLQSNNTSLVRAYIDDEINHHNQGVSLQQMSFPSIGFGPSSGGFSSFSSFHTPARIQGDHDEEQDGNKPSYVASNSRH